MTYICLEHDIQRLDLGPSPRSDFSEFLLFRHAGSCEDTRDAHFMARVCYGIEILDGSWEENVETLFQLEFPYSLFPVQFMYTLRSRKL